MKGNCGFCIEGDDLGIIFIDCFKVYEGKVFCCWVVLLICKVKNKNVLMDVIFGILLVWCEDYFWEYCYF